MTLVIKKLTGSKLICAKSFTWNETVWNPSMIQTALWLDAADASTITTVSGTVSQWSDKSGNGRNATATSTACPSYSANSFNGKPGLTFNGTTNIMRADALTVIVQGPDVPWSVMSVGNLTSGSTARSVLAFGSSSTGHLHSLGTSEANLLTTNRRDGAYSLATVTGTDVVSANRIFGMTFGGTSATLYQNGSLDSTGACDVGSLNVNLNNFSIGASIEAGTTGKYISCVLSEVLIVSGAIATNNRERIEGYLAHKWGLVGNLPSGHPYKTVGPTP